MAGSGKTSLMQRLIAHLSAESEPCYVLNMDPAVRTIPYEPNIDIRDTVNYKEVMKQYGLGPNGGNHRTCLSKSHMPAAIVTSLNLFATRFDQVLEIVEQRALENKYILIDTPGQIEVRSLLVVIVIIPGVHVVCIW